MEERAYRREVCQVEGYKREGKVNRQEVCQIQGYTMEEVVRNMSCREEKSEESSIPRSGFGCSQVFLCNLVSKRKQKVESMLQHRAKTHKSTIN